MQITRLVYNKIADLLAADTTTFNQVADNLHVLLTTNAFTPSLDITLADLEFATFAGSTPKLVGLAAQQVFTDAQSGNRVMQLLEPAGGWTWEASATPAEAETITGYAVTNEAEDTLYGVERLDQSVTIDLIEDAVTLPNIRVTFPPNATF